MNFKIMRKKMFALTLFLVFAWPCAVFAATPNPGNNVYTYNYTNSDPFHLYSPSFDIDNVTLRYSSGYGFGDVDFFYQLRDITGNNYYDYSSNKSGVAGPQWFATVYENYSTVYNNVDINNNPNNNRNDPNNQVLSRNVYRRTSGGQIDDISLSVIGDIIDGFNFVFAEEPQPYEPWLNYTVNDNNVNTLTTLYDRYPDPLESLCVVTSGGTAKLKVRFANPYARHFPFWWNWYGDNTSTGNSWWQNMYNWTNIMPSYTVEPVAYIYNPSDKGIYSRSIYSTYSKVYAVSTSGDLSYIDDLAGNHLYVTSGDTAGTNYSICSGDVIYYLVSGDTVYNSSGALAYTLESAWNDNCVYVCSPRYIKESVALDGFNDSEYSVRISPSNEQDVYSTEYLNATINITGDSEKYGSRLAYLTFKQRASFMQGYENFREASPIPFVFANVSRGNASDNPLIFDLTVSDPDSGRIIKRVKFKWDVQNNRTNQDLGKFFTMNPYGTVSKNYDIETKITNRTGTRYMLYRYDGANSGSNSRSYTLPKYWKYDLTDDFYGTLPKKFLLDAHSQIAPGLVTVYGGNIDLTGSTKASFRLYEYNSSNPKELWLNYKCIGNMEVAGAPIGLVDRGMGSAADDPLTSGDDSVTVQTFKMKFADVKSDDLNTEKEIKSLTGKIPVIHEVTEKQAVPYRDYPNSSAKNAFRIDETLIDTSLLPKVYEVIITSSDTDSGDVVTTYSTENTGKMAVMPMAIRLKIPSEYLHDIWEDLDSAEDFKTLFRIFRKNHSVWVRSSATGEYDHDLFSALDYTEAGNGGKFSAEDCVSAFVDENYLYLDFMIFAADAASRNTAQKTAFVKIFEDDGEPYILIGDGKVDAKIDLAFYVSAPGESETSTASQNTGTTNGSGGGGSCNVNPFAVILFVPIFALKSQMKK